MTIATMLVVAALVFGLCFLVDKGFSRLFRSRVQHRSGRAVRANKRYALAGLALLLLGVLALVSGLVKGLFFVTGCCFVFVLGAGLIGYYLSFGVFYDEDSFLYTTFGKKAAECRFGEIRGQRLYVLQGGNILIELHLADGRAISLTSAMEGTYPFLDHAFSAWCRQTGRTEEGCDFHDPSQNLWFPTQEDT